MTEIRLGAGDVELLNVAQRALLSPLSSDDPIAWQLGANKAVRQLIRADHSVFSMPGETGPSILTDDTDPAFPDRFLDYCIGVEMGEYRFRDPLVDQIGRARRAAGTGAFHELALGNREAIRRSAAYQELFIPAGLTHLVGFSTPLAVGEATQFFSFEGAGAAKRSEQALTVLRLLVPAFEAGVRIQRQLGVQHNMLASVLDRVGGAAAVYSRTGSQLHQTATLDHLLAGESESAMLRNRADTFARALCARWSGASSKRGTLMASDASEYMTTGSAGYRLLGSYLDADQFGREGVLILIERLQPSFPPTADLRPRFGLTAREAEVALLLAHGLTDPAIADRLEISPHTARRYSERVLRKLKLHSRAAVAVTLLRGMPSQAG